MVRHAGSYVQRRHVAELLLQSRHIPYQANRTLGVLSKVFNLAEVWVSGPRVTNPCRHVQKYNEKKRERFLSADEYVRLGQALAEAQRSDKPSSAIARRFGSCS